MSVLGTLKNSSRGRSPRKKVGRGTGAGTGKTCGRGMKGQGARSGYKRRYGNEGGQCPQFTKLPTRGFTRGPWKKTVVSINLGAIDKLYSDGETVNETSLRAHGYLGGQCDSIKVLGEGELTKKVTIEVNAISEGAKQKLDKAKISYALV